MKIVLMKMMINFQEIKGKHIIEEIRIIMVIRNKQKIKKIIINKIKINIKSLKLQTSKMMKKNNLLILMKNQKIKLIKTKIIFKVNLATIKFNKINSKIHTLDFRIWWLSSKMGNNKIKKIKGFKNKTIKILKTIFKQDLTSPK